MGELNRRTALLGMGGAATLAACGESTEKQSAPRESLTWRMTTCWPKNFPGLGTTAQTLADFITQASEGRLTIELFAAGEIVPAFEAIDAVSAGVVDMGHGSPYYWKGKMPACQFLTSVPFGLDADEQIAWYADGDGQAIADAIYAELGCKFFAAGNSGAQMGGWFNRQINDPQDFSGLKIRMPGLGGEVLKALGANVVNVPAGEVAVALQSGAVDAVDWVGPYNDLVFGLHRDARYYYYPGWHEPCATLDCFINLKKWEALPRDVQAIVATACAAVNQLTYAEFYARNVESLHRLIGEYGVDVRPFSRAVLNKLAQVSHQVIGDIAATDTHTTAVYDSLVSFLNKTRGWSEASQGVYLGMRYRALGL